MENAICSVMKRPRRVLIVDDNKETAFSLAKLLEFLKCEVLIAYDGVEALRVAVAFKPEVIFLDIGMPKLDGIDACGVIRRQHWGNELTIVAVTGLDGEEERQRTREAGFDHHLVKPVHLDRIKEVLDL